MKLKHILLCLCALLAGAASALGANKTERPDLEAIRRAVNDPAGKMYYPRLMQRFTSDTDTSLTAEEYRHIYYGYLFQEDYEPYRHGADSTGLRQMQPLYAKADNRRTQADYKRIRDYADKALADNPLDLRQINYRIYAYEKLGKINLAKIWQHKLNHLLEVIGNSGTGRTPEEARIVVLLQHEYDFLNMSGRQVTDSEYQEPHYDYVRIQQKATHDPQGFYFDVEPILQQYYLKHPQETP